MFGTVPWQQNKVLSNKEAVQVSDQALLAETCWDLLSICKTIDLLLKELSLFKSILMGARVAPFSPVGCQWDNID